MLRKTTLNAKLERDNGSERQNWRDGSECQMRVDYGSERRMEKLTLALNANIENATPNVERRCGSKRQTKQNTTLNAKPKLITMSVKLRKMTPSVIDEKIWWL